MRKTIGRKNYAWIDISQPSEDDIKYLKESFSIHPLTASAIIPAFHPALSALHGKRRDQYPGIRFYRRPELSGVEPPGGYRSFAPGFRKLR
jgi:hypothetical protein